MLFLWFPRATHLLSSSFYEMLFNDDRGSPRWFTISSYVSSWMILISLLQVRFFLSNAVIVSYHDVTLTEQNI
jgi:hypothetical protein